MHNSVTKIVNTVSAVITAGIADYITLDAGVLINC